ncbi:MAG: FAD-dependent oxidoreductase [Pseudobdellovibrionaceae bacterium]
MLGVSSRSLFRKKQIADLGQQEWDYVVIGGGITGAQIFAALSQAGKKVFLIEASDFASGTSSQSGMLIWGGLIYLKKGHLHSVAKFSKAREALIKNDGDNVTPLPVRYIRSSRSLIIYLGFIFYWFLGSCKRKFPKLEKVFPELSIFGAKEKFSYLVEEAILKSSDARYVLNIIFSAISKTAKAMNYLKLIQGSFSEVESKWSLKLHDRILKQDIEIQARHVVNCAGPSTEIVNSDLQIHQTLQKHALSKGVYICLRKPADLESMLVIDLPKERDVITFCPVGQTALWGPTETKIETIGAGFKIESSDIRWLSEKYFESFGRKLNREQIISVRAGVRPLCVPADYSSDEHTLNISRISKVSSFPKFNATTVYGGKFTGSQETAQDFCRSHGIESIGTKNVNQRLQNIDVGYGPNYLSPDPQWTYQNEMCWFLEDYFRRRSHLHQSIHHGGFGLQFENQETVLSIAKKLFADDSQGALESFNEYLATQKSTDQILKAVLNG